MTLRKPFLIGLPLVGVDASARLATLACASEALTRAGATQRMRKLVCAGVSPEVAATQVAQQAKGNIAEYDQSASLTNRAGALGRDLIAYPNPIANDPIDDVVIERRRPKHHSKRGTQLKVVKRLTKAHLHKYPRIVTSAPIPPVIPEGTTVEDRLRESGHEARKLVAADVQAVAELALKKDVEGAPAVGWFDLFLEAFKAGGSEAVVSAALALGWDALKSWWNGAHFDWVNASRDALVQAIRAGARAFLHTFLMAKEHVTRGGRKFSAAALHALGTAAVFLGAVAEVLVEIVSDGIEWLRGRISFGELLERIPVHVLTAGGSALGVVLAAGLAEGSPWWAQMTALVVFGALGANVGRVLGEDLFSSQRTLRA